MELPIYSAAVSALVGLANSEEVATPHMLRPPFLNLAAAMVAEKRASEH